MAIIVCLLSQITHPDLIKALNDLASLLSVLIQSVCLDVARPISSEISFVGFASSLLLLLLCY